MEEVFEKTPVESKPDSHNTMHRVLRTGKRTYFIDLQSSFDDDVYISVTESKKCYYPDGGFYYERHKLFLFKEDFREFMDELSSMMDVVNSGEFDLTQISKRENSMFQKKKYPVFIKKHSKMVGSESDPPILTDQDLSFDSVELEDVSLGY